MSTQFVIKCESCRMIESRVGESFTDALMKLKMLGLTGWALRCDGPKSMDLCPECAAKKMPRIYRAEFSDQ